MGTRSLIAVQRGDHFESIYCHWDGYLDHVGETLVNHYTDPTKVDALIALGNLSSLGTEIGTKHDFNARDDDLTTAYGRDRGDDDEATERDADLNALLKRADGCGTEYVYVYQDGAWLVTFHGEFRAFGVGPGEGSPWQSLQTVEAALAQEAAEA